MIRTAQLSTAQQHNHLMGVMGFAAGALLTGPPLWRNE